MEDKIRRKEISIRINTGDESYLFDPHYDSVHIYPWLGHAIIRIITEDGQGQLHTSQAHAEAISEAARVRPYIEESIGERAWTAYLKYQEQTVDDSWLE
jgi:hypothetical protein